MVNFAFLPCTYTPIAFDVCGETSRLVVSSSTSMFLYDCSDPTAPVQLLAMETPLVITRVSIQQQYVAYASDYEVRLSLFDIQKRPQVRSNNMEDGVGTSPPIITLALSEGADEDSEDEAEEHIGGVASRPAPGSDSSGLSCLFDDEGHLVTFQGFSSMIEMASVKESLQEQTKRTDDQDACLDARRLQMKLRKRYRAYEAMGEYDESSYITFNNLSGYTLKRGRLLLHRRFLSSDRIVSVSFAPRPRAESVRFLVSTEHQAFLYRALASASSRPCSSAHPSSSASLMLSSSLPGSLSSTQPKTPHVDCTLLSSYSFCGDLVSLSCDEKFIYCVTSLGLEIYGLRHSSEALPCMKSAKPIWSHTYDTSDPLWRTNFLHAVHFDGHLALLRGAPLSMYGPAIDSSSSHGGSGQRTTTLSNIELGRPVEDGDVEALIAAEVEALAQGDAAVPSDEKQSNSGSGSPGDCEAKASEGSDLIVLEMAPILSIVKALHDKAALIWESTAKDAPAMSSTTDTQMKVEKEEKESGNNNAKVKLDNHALQESLGIYLEAHVLLEAELDQLRSRFSSCSRTPTNDCGGRLPNAVELFELEVAKRMFSFSCERVATLLHTEWNSLYDQWCSSHGLEHTSKSRAQISLGLPSMRGIFTAAGLFAQSGLPIADVFPRLEVQGSVLAKAHLGEVHTAHLRQVLSGPLTRYLSVALTSSNFPVEQLSESLKSSSSSASPSPSSDKSVFADRVLFYIAQYAPMHFTTFLLTSSLLWAPFNAKRCLKIIKQISSSYRAPFSTSDTGDNNDPSPSPSSQIDDDDFSGSSMKSSFSATVNLDAVAQALLYIRLRDFKEANKCVESCGVSAFEQVLQYNHRLFSEWKYRAELVEFLVSNRPSSLLEVLVGFVSSGALPLEGVLLHLPSPEVRIRSRSSGTSSGQSPARRRQTPSSPATPSRSSSSSSKPTTSLVTETAVGMVDVYKQCFLEACVIKANAHHTRNSSAACIAACISEKKDDDTALKSTATLLALLYVDHLSLLLAPYLRLKGVVDVAFSSSKSEETKEREHTTAGQKHEDESVVSVTDHLLVQSWSKRHPIVWLEKDYVQATEKASVAPSRFAFAHQSSSSSTHTAMKEETSARLRGLLLSDIPVDVSQVAHRLEQLGMSLCLDDLLSNGWAPTYEKGDAQLLFSLNAVVLSLTRNHRDLFVPVLRCTPSHAFSFARVFCNDSTSWMEFLSILNEVCFPSSSSSQSGDGGVSGASCRTCVPAASQLHVDEVYRHVLDRMIGVVDCASIVQLLPKQGNASLFLPYLQKGFLADRGSRARLNERVDQLQLADLSEF